jgi:phage minor structural protein
MIQVYADDALVYDSRDHDLALLGLEVNRGLNKGGAATLTMPPHHVAYSSFTSYRTVVTIYRDQRLLFRGRALYPTDDFQLRRTITCEGERCFLRDGIIRPYAYQDAPAAIFADMIGLYNAQVESFKQFVVGTVTVTDPNNYIRLESYDAETFADAIDKLVERCGGYIVFTDGEDGRRVINWLKDINQRSAQLIELGVNLLDFQRSTANSDLATVVVPYGAKVTESGLRLTIESVNDGLDFIQDHDAVALRGVICKAVTWDDVTTPQALLAKAQQYLEESKKLITSLELTAFDLSLIDKNVDNFELGDTITVRSRPHGLHDELYQLTEQNLDLLNPQRDRITLGLHVASMTGADVAGDRQSSYAIQRVERNVKADYNLNVAAQIEALEVSLSSLIQQTSDALRLEVSESYATNGDVESLVTSSMTQLAESFTFAFDELRAVVDDNDTNTRGQLEEIHSYIRFEDGDIILGESGNEITLRIENDRISFLDAGAEVAYFSDKHLTVLDGSFLNSLQVGAFAFLPRANGNLSLLKVGE